MDTQAWRRVGQWAAVLAAGGFLTQSVLFLLDVTGALAPQVEYRVSGRGLEEDLITFYVEQSTRMHDIWWSVSLRDVMGPVAYLALVVAAMAVVRVLADSGPRAVVGQLLVTVGALAAALSDVMFLGHVAWWRQGPLQPTPDVIAHGRAFEVVDVVGQRVQWAGLVVLAAGLLALVPLVARAVPSMGWLSVLGYLEVVALLGFVVTTAAGAGWPANVLAAASGVVLGPALAVALGRALEVPEWGRVSGAT